MVTPSRSFWFIGAGCLLSAGLGAGLVWILGTKSDPVAQPPAPPPRGGLCLTCPVLSPATPGWLPIPAEGQGELPEVPKSLEPRVGHWRVVWGETPNRVYLLCDPRLPWIVHGKADCRDLFASGSTSSLVEQRCDQRIMRAHQRVKKQLVQARRRPPRALLAQYKGRMDLLWSAGRNVRIVQGQADSLASAWSRAESYLSDVENVFRSQGIPAELARMVIVESLGHPAAGSPRGAQGAFQFVTGTARSYLRVDAEVDERYDPVRAGWAAAQYLKELFRQFDHWGLALTAYNTGPSRLKRLIQRRRTDDLGILADSGTHGDFGFDGQNYYAQIAAVIELTRNRPLPHRNSPPVAVEVVESAPLPVFALCLGVSLADLIAVNAALTGGILVQGKPVPQGYLMRLPDGADLGRTVVGGATPGSVALQ